MLDTNEILALLKGSLEQFADRSTKWLLANIDNLRGLLEIIGSDIVGSLDFSIEQGKAEAYRQATLVINFRVRYMSKSPK